MYLKSKSNQLLEEMLLNSKKFLVLEVRKNILSRHLQNLVDRVTENDQNSSLTRIIASIMRLDKKLL